MVELRSSIAVGRAPRFIIAAVVAVLCGAAPGSAAQRLSGHVPHEVANSRLVRRASQDNPLNLAIGLPLRNQEKLDRLLADIADPSSPNFHQYLTPEQFANQFGPTEDDYNALIGFAQSHGLSVTATHPNRMLLDVSGTSGAVEKSFHLNMMIYQHPVRGQFYAPDREPTLDLDVKVLDIAGLDNFQAPRPMALKTAPLTQFTPFVTGSGPGGLFIGKDFRAAYAPGVTLDGTGQTVGLLEFDGFYASDVQANFAHAGLPPVPTQTVLLDGFNGSPGADNIEVILDIAMAGYMAPAASKIIVYEGTYPNDVLNRMATDNLAQQLSSSWGFSPVNATTEQIFKQFIAQGQSFYQASGDNGAYKAAVMPPSDDPNVTVVGGSSLTTSGAGGPWQSESTWSGSGGGVSTIYPIPTYQQGMSMAANGGSTTMRNIPDVALTADVQIFLICNNGQSVSVGGTSAAAPLWAGFTALANEKAAAVNRPRIGFVNPTIYSIGRGANYLSDFHDLTLGNNSGFSAVTGYDLATGWGSPAGQQLIDDLIAVPSAPAFLLTSSQSALSANPGGSALDKITVVPQNGFAGPVSLTITGLPPSVTASFSPASTSGTSTLTFTAGSSAPLGVSVITVTGVSGTLKSVATLSLTVAVPGFTLSATSPSLTLKQAATVGTGLTVGPNNGFNGSVSLTASGLPAGVTASFGVPSTTSATTVTFTSSAATPTGTATVTITGTSGALKSSVAIALTTVAPNFSVAMSAGSVSVPVGAGTSNILSVMPLNGFTGSVTVAASGLPSGVTLSFGPASIFNTSVLTLTAAGSALAAKSTITITATSGNLSHTVTFGLTVVAPTAGSTLVNLASAFNVTAMVTDGTTFAPIAMDGGLNGIGTAYSSSLLGGQQTMTGTTFLFGPADNPNAVTGKTIPLPKGQFTAIKLLASAVNGNQASQTFTVTYSDGTTASFVQSLSDWFSPQNFPGESKAVTMAYRDTSAGLKDNRTFLLYGYSFALNAAKTVSSITLPSNRDVVTLAISLSAPVTPAAATVSVNLSTAFNTTGISTDGKPLAQGLDGLGFGYSANLLGSNRTVNNATFNFGPPDAPDAVSGARTIALPQGNFSSLQMLATAVNGSQVGQTFKVTYTDGTSTTFTQSLSDWFRPQSFSGESNAITMAHRNSKTGQPDNGPYYLYGYSFPLNKLKTPSSLTLAGSAGVKVFAVTLAP